MLNQLGKTSPASMGSKFNPKVLVEKLTMLNTSRTSIETLSHWCINHRYRARQVVEIWNGQFHRAPRVKRLAFLYLANDILQNCRRKGSDFVGEFWKVLPDALRDVIENGNEYERVAATKLINIWEDRKVFGSRGTILEEEDLGSGYRNGEGSGQLRHNAGIVLDKIVAGYQIVYGGPIDDEAVLSKCGKIVVFFDKVDKETNGDRNSEKFWDPAFMEELQGQSSMLSDCIDQLNKVESSRARLVSNLREALQEQEFKLHEVRSRLQDARPRSEEAKKLCHQFLNDNNNNGQLSVDRSLKDAQSYNPLQPPPLSSPSPFPHSESRQIDNCVPLPPTSPPPMSPIRPVPLYPKLPPLLPPPFMPLPRPIRPVPYYGRIQQQPPLLPKPSLPLYTPIPRSLPPFTVQLPPPSPYTGFPGSGSNFNSHPSSVPMTPMSW